MTKLLDKAFDAARKLPPAEQDQIAREILALTEPNDVEEDFDAAALPGVLEGIADADAGRIATDAEIEAAFRRFEK